MKNDKIYDIIIGGGGPSGYTTALYAARAGLSAIVLEKMMPGGQMAQTMEIENYPGIKKIDGYTLSMQMKENAESAGAVTEMVEVTSVDLKGKIKTVETTSGKISGKTLVLALGAVPRPLGIPEEQEMRGRGVSYCATCDGNFYRGKTVVVAGGGNSAVEDALYLSNICKKVYLVHRRDKLKASKAEASRLLNQKNVEFIWNTQVVSLEHEIKLTGVNLKNTISGEEALLKCDGLFVAIGRMPDTELLKGVLPLTDEGYIIADETTKTEIPGVFAAGDVRNKPFRQIVTSASDGAVAAHFAQAYLETTQF